MNDSRTATIPSIRALTCPQCGGGLALRAAGQTVTMVCEHCGASLDTTDETPRLIAAATEAMHRPRIALGTRGTLDGVLWEAVGYLERTDGEEDWSEYLLFNPYEGYAFLVDEGSGFSLGRLLDRLPDDARHGVRFDGRRFGQQGDPYPVRVQFVVGEFYWRVTVGEQVTATNYTASGQSLSCEDNGAERTWTLLDHLRRGTAEAAFAIAPKAPAPVHQPALAAAAWPWGRLARESTAIAIAAAIAMLVIAIANGSGDRLLATRIVLPIDANTGPSVAGVVTVDRRPARVAIEARADTLDNGWVDLDYALVDRRTQVRYDAYTTAERYRGRDADGDWSEGNPDPDIALAAIPPGTYDLVVEGEAHRWVGAQDAAPVPAFGTIATVPVDITVERGGIFFGNLLLGWLALAIWPAIAWCLHVAAEAQRLGDD